LILDYFRLSFC